LKLVLFPFCPTDPCFFLLPYGKQFLPYILCNCQIFQGNWINQPDAADSQVYYLSFKYSSTCFGHPHAHHQGRPDHNQQHCYHQAPTVNQRLLQQLL
jgi:hypothetical protein